MSTNTEEYDRIKRRNMKRTESRRKPIANYYTECSYDDSDTNSFEYTVSTSTEEYDGIIRRKMKPTESRRKRVTKYKQRF